MIRIPSYDSEKKTKAVAEAIASGNIKKTAAEHGVSWQTLKSWMNKADLSEATAPVKRVRKIIATESPVATAFADGNNSEECMTVKGLAEGVFSALESGDVKDGVIMAQRQEIEKLKASIASLKKMLKAIIDQA